MKKTTTHDVLTGICSCCLGRFVVERNEMVLHGYTRPGDGAAHGRCLGMTFPPYEISTKGCEYMRDHFKAQAVRLRNRAAQLRSGQITKIVRTKSVYTAGRGHEEVDATFTPDSTAEDFRSIYVWSWAELVKSEADKADREARYADQDAKQFQDMIDVWKPGLEFISEARLNADAQAVRDAKRAAADLKRNFKALKAAFFHIGAAINKHKRGWLHAEWDWAQHSPERYANIPRLPSFNETYPKEKR